MVSFIPVPVVSVATFSMMYFRFSLVHVLCILLTHLSGPASKMTIYQDYKHIDIADFKLLPFSPTAIFEHPSSVNLRGIFGTSLTAVVLISEVYSDDD